MKSVHPNAPPQLGQDDVRSVSVPVPMRTHASEGLASGDVETVGPSSTMRIEERVAYVQLDRPYAANTLTLQLCTELSDYVDVVAANPEVAVLVLSGAGKRFCAGGDLNEIDSAPDRRTYIHDMVTSAHGLARRLHALGKPIIASVHGAAAGAGLSLALLSDIVIAERATKFASAYSTVGLTPDLGQSFWLPRVVGMGRAQHLTLEGSVFSAEEAHRWGLVSRVVDGDPLVEAREVARTLAQGPFQARGDARRLLRMSMAEGFEAHLDAEAASIVAAVARPEAGRLIEDAARR
ncbi:enoyl-CoA hydratase/isomerase family protein [Rhodococcus jostii]|uniref:enoyl-CoA hydratase/isomerase family protein n=1 Tax=Rhodococcus jostii TaxID=132919 RepID=UPI003662E13F